MNRTLRIVNAIALVLTIMVNYMSNTGIFFGNTMKTISDRYHNLFTPAGYAFSIWGLIYLGLLGFVLYSVRPLFSQKVRADETVEKVGWWFVISCACNSLWIMAWLSDAIGLSVLLMAALLFSLLKIIVNTRMELDYQPLKRYVFIYWPFAIYAGWVTVAFIANIAAWLTKMDWNGWGNSDITWTVILIVIAGMLNLILIWKRNLREFAAAGIWALIAIAVEHRAESPTILYTCYAVAGILFVAMMLSALKSKRTMDAM